MPANHPSLQRDLALGLALALVAVLAVQWALASLVIRQATRDYMVSRLTHDAENLLGNLDLNPDPPVLAEGRVDVIYTQPWSGHYFEIRHPGGVLRSRSLWDTDLTVPPGAFPRERVVAQAGPQGQTVLVFTRSYAKQGKAVTITVAEAMSGIEWGVLVLQSGFAGISLVAIALLLFLQRRLLRRALVPLSRAGEAVRRLERGETGGIPLEGMPVEILPFLEAINRLLTVLGERLERSRQAAGNMAHAIKTPLTVLMQLAEGEGWGERTREKVVRQIELMRALTGRELKRVRLAGARAPVARIRIDEELAALLEVMRRVHRGRGIEIRGDWPLPLWARVDREDLLELTGNLLDNACKWAVRVVAVRVAVRDGGWHLRVEDDGPGCPPEHHARILERGGRADGGVQGYGIGLAVVREIVADHGGRLDLGVSPELGGFCAEVTLPLKGLSVGAPTGSD